MKAAVFTLLLATACGDTDVVYISEPSGDTNQADNVQLLQSEYISHRQNADTGAKKNANELRGPRDQNVDPSREVQALCFSHEARIFQYVRYSIRRFGESLEIPVVLGEGCLPITVQEVVQDQGKSVSGLAHYRRLCQWTDCERYADIRIAEINLTEQVEWLPNLLDHEIGHVLSSWGNALHVDQHVQEDGHIMSVLNKRTNHWTQEDIDLWCSASPCGKTRMEPSWLSPVSDAGTSYLSVDGSDDGVPTDAGALTDAN